MSKKITILLVEDNKDVREAFRMLLELETDLEVAGEANNGLKAVIMAAKLCPDVVLMDVAMPKLNGLQATRQILANYRGTKVLMLSTYTDEVYVQEALSAGASGYLIKQSAADCVVEAIREVHQGRRFFSPAVRKFLSQQKVKKKRG